MSSAYPMHVDVTTHKNGNKSFKIYLIRTGDERGAVLKKWGKSGAFGDIETLNFDTYEKACEAVIGVEDGLGSSKFSIASQKSHSVNSIADLRDALSVPVFARFGKTQLQILDPEADVGALGLREQEEAKFDENFQWKDGVRSRAETDSLNRARKAIQEQKKLEEQEAQTAYSSNDLYGAF